MTALSFCVCFQSAKRVSTSGSDSTGALPANISENNNRIATIHARIAPVIQSMAPDLRLVASFSGLERKGARRGEAARSSGPSGAPSVNLRGLTGFPPDRTTGPGRAALCQGGRFGSVLST